MTFNDFLLNNYSFIANRAFKTSNWDDECGDSKKNYSKKDNKYSEKDIVYKYNSHGFRCDEFLDTEIPILFLGCSVTEGYALPLEKTWSYLVLEKIRAATGKKIAYWNLAVAGVGIGTQSNLLFNFRNKITKPAFIFSFMPPFTRIEVKFGPSTQFIFSRKFNNKKLDNFFSDENLCKGVIAKSIEYFDTIAESCTFYYAGWGHSDLEYNVVRKADNLSLIFPSDESFNDLASFDLARDKAHPGELFHQALADKYWESIKHHFEKDNG